MGLARHMRGGVGFTLIELIVVIAMLGVLATVLITIINPLGQLAKARDAGRVSTMAQIRGALDEYLISNGDFPPPNSGGGSSCSSACGGWEVAGCGVPWIKALIDGGFIRTDIKDPSINGTPACYNLNYYRYGAGSYGCDITKGDFYVLGIRNLESESNPSSSSPGFSCSGRDWQGEFDWVVGKFQK